MVLPKTTKQDGTEVVSMYMPCLTNHLPELDVEIDEVKRIVKEMGGRLMHLADFSHSLQPHQTSLSRQRTVMCVDQ